MISTRLLFCLIHQPEERSPMTLLLQLRFHALLTDVAREVRFERVTGS